MPDAPEVTTYALQVRQPPQVSQRSTLPQARKRKDQEDNDKGDKSRAQEFQEPKNVVNIIFGGDGGFPSKHAPKLTLHEILSVEPTTQKPLRYSEVPISFSRDDQWTSFFEPGKFPLVLDPVVARSQLTRVLIEGRSGLNLLFTSALKKMGLDISKMLTPIRASFYNIIPGNAATPLDLVVQLPLGRRTTTTRSTSSSRWLTPSRHTMLSSADQHCPSSWLCPTTSTCYSR
jgi:hypothetical protein